MGDGSRTRDIQIHILVLYQLSYTHRALHLVGVTMPKPAGIVKGRSDYFPTDGTGEGLGPRQGRSESRYRTFRSGGRPFPPD